MGFHPCCLICKHGVGGGVAVAVAAREGPAVGLRDEDVGAAVRLAAADEIDDVEHVERPDAPEDDRWEQRRLQQRKRHEVKALPAARPVDLGGLLEVPRDRLKRAERDHHHEGEAEPGVRRDVRGERGRPVGEPGHGLDADQGEEPVDRAELAVEHALPDERGDVARHRPRQDEQRPEHAAEAHPGLAQEHR